MRRTFGTTGSRTGPRSDVAGYGTQAGRLATTPGSSSASKPIDDASCRATRSRRANSKTAAPPTLRVSSAGRSPPCSRCCAGSSNPTPSFPAFPRRGPLPCCYVPVRRRDDGEERLPPWHRWRAWRHQSRLASRTTGRRDDRDCHRHASPARPVEGTSGVLDLGLVRIVAKRVITAPAVAAQPRPELSRYGTPTPAVMFPAPDMGNLTSHICRERWCTIRVHGLA